MVNGFLSTAAGVVRTIAGGNRSGSADEAVLNIKRKFVRLSVGNFLQAQLTLLPPYEKQGSPVAK